MLHTYLISAKMLGYVLTTSALLWIACLVAETDGQSSQCAKGKFVIY